MTDISQIDEQREPRTAASEPVPTGTTVITKHFVFEAAHYLPSVPDDHKCRRMHGHSYQVWLHVRGAVDPRYGWIVDFGDVKDLWKPLDARLDHRLLNEIAGLEIPTAENLASWIWRECDTARRQGTASFDVVAVEVAETFDSRALFVAPGQTPWVPGHPAVSLPEEQVAPRPFERQASAPAHRAPVDGAT